MVHTSGDEGTAGLLRMLDELIDLKRKKSGAGHVSAPSSTVGIVLNGTSIEFMIPGGPAHEEGVLETQDRILEVDGVQVDCNTIEQALRGTDEVDSMVRLAVQKADDGKRIEVVLKRASITYIHHMQVYGELLDQLKNACKRNSDLSDLVRRLASKVKELDAYHNSTVYDLRKSLRRFNAIVPEVADKLRATSTNAQANPGSSMTSAETHRLIDRLQYQLQIAEENQVRLKEQLDLQNRFGSGEDAGISHEVQRLQVLLRESEKDKDSLHFRLDQMTKDVQRLMQSKGAQQNPPTNGRLSEIRTARKEHYIMMEQEIEDLTTQVQDFESILATTRQELEECKAREQTAQDQALNFSRQLEKKQQECALLQADVFRLNRLKDQVANSTITQQQLREAERQLQEAMQRESELDAKLSRATESMHQMQADASMRESELRTDITRLKEQLRACKGELHEVNQDRDKLRNSDHNMRQQMAESQAELETLKRRSSEIEADLSRRNQNTRDELSQCQNRLQQINDQLNDALQSERRLKTMSSEAHAIAEHLQAARTQSEKEFSERLQAVEDELQRANAKVLHYKSREQELSTKENLLNRRIRDMEDELRVLQNTLRDTQASLHKANSKSTELADKLQRQELDRSKFEEEIATDKERLNREKQKLSSRLSAAEDAIQQYEKQLSDTKMELRKSTDYARELESKTHELEHNLSTCRQQTQALSDDFSQHSKARDWQLEALKTRLQVSDEKCKKACEREDELLKQLEAKHNEMARLECTSVQKELQSRQQIDAQQLKIKSLEDIVSHTKQDNEALHKLLEMPAEEFAFQAIERSGPMARTFRKSELPARRTSTSGLSIAHKPLFTPRDMPSQVPSSFASVQIKDETPVSCQGDELPQRDADLQKELSDLRTKMKSMDLSSDSSPKSNRYTTTHLPISQASQWPSHDVPIEADKKEKRDSTTHETRQPTKLTAKTIISSLNSSLYQPSTRQPFKPTQEHIQLQSQSADYLI